MTTIEIFQSWSRSETIATPTAGSEAASSAPALSVTSAWNSPAERVLPIDAKVIISTEPGSEAGQASASTTLLYPQMFEAGEPAERALRLVGDAAEAADSALMAYGIADLEAIGSKLAQIAAIMAEAHRLTHFNENFGAVVSFVRRAALAAAYMEVSREALNSLVAVLKQLVREPMLDLEAAANAISHLEDDGWQGQHKVVEQFLLALFDDLSAKDQAQNLNKAPSETHA